MADTDFSLPEGTHTVVLGMGDLNGIMRGKRIPASHWDAICKGGNAFSLVLLAVDMNSEVWDTPHANFDNGFPDFHMFPMSKPASIPWEPGVAMSFGRAEDRDHKPVPIDPRIVLERQVKRAADMGFDVQVGTELEFYLLDPETNLPKDKGISVYGLDRASELEHVLGPIRSQINEFGIAIEQSNPEYAAGQVEVNMLYGPALQSADRVVMFRSLVKQLAAHHGYKASFMAKPFYNESGSGFHAHYSLWRDGKNAFSDDGKLNALGLNFIAGQQRRMSEMTICGAATVNGYRRKQPNSFCPMNTCWGIDNRTCGLRVIEGSPAAVRVEKRDAGADCNPYFLLAADIAAGLDGIEQGLQPTERTHGNAYNDATAEQLPTDLGQAVRLARGSEWLKDVLGDIQFELYLQQSEREISFFSQQVTQLELDRYLDAF